MLTDPKFKWTPSHKTDVRETWRKFGWRPMEKSPTQVINNRKNKAHD